MYKWIVFMFIFSLALSLKGQVTVLSDPIVQHLKTQELKWWELSINNPQCHEMRVTLTPATDSSQIKHQLFWKDTHVKNSQINVQAHSGGVLQIFHQLFTLYDTVDFNLHLSGEHLDTTIQLRAKVNKKLQNVPHCFPKQSSGKFKIYTGDLENPQVLIMDESRTILKENSTEALFLDIKEFKSGRYIVQIGEQEFYIRKTDFQDFQ